MALSAQLCHVYPILSSCDRQTFPLTHGNVYYLGRDPECEIRVNDPLVSSKHCHLQ